MTKTTHATRFVLAAALVLLALTLVPVALADKGGGGHAGTTGHADPSASCSVAGTVVTASGLPTDQVVNFMVSDASGTYGWVLGYTWDGTFTVNVPAPNGATTYQFVSRTWGPNGSKYNVFASCSA